MCTPSVAGNNDPVRFGFHSLENLIHRCSSVLWQVIWTEEIILSHSHICIPVVICQSQTSGNSAAQSWILSAPTEAGPPSWLTLKCTLGRWRDGRGARKKNCNNQNKQKIAASLFISIRSLGWLAHTVWAWSQHILTVWRICQCF